MYSIVHFEAFIQLISAVNFMYILTKFSNKVYERIFDENRMFTQRFTNYTDALAANGTTLEKMSPITTIEGMSTEQAINDLRQKYQNLETRWHKTADDVKEKIAKMNDVRGLRCLFLYASLFCIIDLFNIAWYNAAYTDFSLIFTFTFNIICSFYLVVISIIVWFEKWKEKDDSYCYEWTTTRFVLSLGIALGLTVINWGLQHFFFFPIPQTIYCILSLFCIVNAVFPLLFTVIYIKVSVYKIGKYTMDQTKDLKEEFEGLNADKKKIDHTYEVLASDVVWQL